MQGDQAHYARTAAAGAIILSVANLGLIFLLGYKQKRTLTTRASPITKV